MKNDKPNDTINQVFAKYKLKEPIDSATLQYGNQQEKVIYKNILKKAGKKSWYILLLGIVYSTMRLLPKFGIPGTFIKATVALVTTASIGTFAIYQGTTAIISVVKSSQDKIEHNKIDVKPAQPIVETKKTIVTKPQTKQVTTLKKKKKNAQLLRPEIGVYELEPFVPDINSKKITQQFLGLLPKTRYTIIRKNKKSNRFLTHYIRMSLDQKENTYQLWIRIATVKRSEIKYTKVYRFSDLAELNTIMNRAANELLKTKL